MKNKRKFIIILFFIFLFSISCEVKTFKSIDPPRGPDTYVKDNANPGTETTFKENLKTSFTAGGPKYKYNYQTTLNQAYPYQPIGNTCAIKDSILGLVYVYEKDKTLNDLASGIFRVITNDTKPDEFVYIGITIMGDGCSLYITDTETSAANLSWNRMFLYDSRVHTKEEMWLKNFQENRSTTLIMKNSGRMVEENRYLIPVVLVFHSALSSSRAIYSVHGTVYYVGTEFQRAGKKIYVSYTEWQIKNLSLAKSPSEIEWTKMQFADNTKRYNTPVY